MNLDIIKIASNTENHKIIENPTHFSKDKNAICGDEMSIGLIIQNNEIVDFGYQCKSCIYCQASVSLLSRTTIKMNLNDIIKLLNESKNFFKKNNEISNKWKIFKNIINEKNFSRKECLLLPFKTLSKTISSKNE